MGVFQDFERLEAEGKTPIDKTICPDCGKTMVMIGVTVTPPLMPGIWETIFSEMCVHTADWRWCCGRGVLQEGGHLDVRVSR